MIFPWSWAARAHLKYLEDELAFWRQQWLVERQRAERALDRLLMEKQLAPISAPLVPDEPTPDPVEVRVRELLSTEDALRAGQG